LISRITADRIAARLRRAWRGLCGIHVPPAPILVSSIPKAGTNLLKNIVLAIPGTRYAGDLGLVTEETDEAVRFGMVSKVMQDLWPADVYTGHVPYGRSIADFLVGHGVRHVFIYRDPRDVAVSHCHYIMRSAGHPNFAMFQAQGSDSGRLMGAIRGIGEGRTVNRLSADCYPNIGLYCDLYLGWMKDSNTFALRYEDIVGGSSGTRSAGAVPAVRRMLGYLGVINGGRHERFVKRVLDSGMDPGKSHTYRKGKTGTWREEFTPEHEVAFKQVAGDLLVRLGYESDASW